ncbi:MAG: hypothetical protein ACK5LV_10605 [Lachnospirales bacterium]
MKKRKGVLLVWVLIILVIISMMTASIFGWLYYREEQTTKIMLESKADEIAYAGYKIMENFIIEETESFENKLDDNLEFKGSFEIPYDNENRVRKTEVTAMIIKQALDDEIGEVNIVSKTLYADETGYYEDSIYYMNSTNETVDPPTVSGNLFPPNSYYEDDGADKAYDRMGVENEPDFLTKEHIEFLKENSNYIDIDSDDFGEGYQQMSLTTDIVNQWVELLEANDDGTKKYHIVFVEDKDATEKLQMFLQEDITIDIRGLRSPDNRPHLVFALHNNGLFKNTQGPLTLTLSGGDFTILTNRIENLHHFVIEQGYMPSLIPNQFTLGSTAPVSQWSINIATSGVKMENSFFYLPSSTVQLGTTWGTPAFYSGGFIAKKVIFNSTPELCEMVNLPWQGDARLFGFPNP